MYNFIDTLRQECFHDSYKPVSAMNYNGVFLEDEVNGYETLSVNGREMINVDFSVDKLLKGSILHRSSLPSRVLAVSYKLSNDDPEKLLLEYRKLMNLLYVDEPVVIWFNDELDVYYEGVYTSSMEVDGSVNSFVGSFTITCPSPFKLTHKTFVSKDGYIGGYTLQETVPFKIEVTSNNDTTVHFSNGKQKIVLMPNTTKKGDKVTVDLLKGKLFINGKNNTNKLELSSDFENFVIKQGMTVTSSVGVPVVTYKGVTL